MTAHREHQKCKKSNLHAALEFACRRVYADGLKRVKRSKMENMWNLAWILANQVSAHPRHGEDVV